MQRAEPIKHGNAEGYVVKQIPFADVPFLKLSSAERYSEFAGAWERMKAVKDR